MTETQSIDAQPRSTIVDLKWGWWEPTTTCRTLPVPLYNFSICLAVKYNATDKIWLKATLWNDKNNQSIYPSAVKQAVDNVNMWNVLKYHCRFITYKIKSLSSNIHYHYAVNKHQQNSRKKYTLKSSKAASEVAISSDGAWLKIVLLKVTTGTTQ